jgi:hypothetical protein
MKSDRVIVRGVRVGGATYAEGQEDELAEVLPQDEADRLVEKGYLTGNWKGSGKKAEPTKTDPAKKAEK